MTACLVCNNKLTLFGPYGSYEYHRCVACSTIQLAPMPSEQDMVRAYEKEYALGKQEGQYADPEWWPRVSRPYCESIIKALRDFGVNGIVVDCGAGWGGLTQAMIKSGFEARGVELSEVQVEYARQHRIPIEQGDLRALSNLDGQVSAVTLLTVFEHLVNHASLLSDVHRVLKDGGILVTLHPTSACAGLFWNLIRLGNKHKPLPKLDGTFTAPWHTVLFSVEGTKEMISRNGFRLLEIRPAPQGRWGGWVSAIQISLELVNKVGWRLFGTRWPLITSYLFIYEKISSVQTK
jgi:SAM-dependent methyltransferase